MPSFAPAIGCGSASATCWSGRLRKCRTWRPRPHLDAFRAQFFLISALAAVFLLALNYSGHSSGNRPGRRFFCSGLPLPPFSIGSAGNGARVRRLERIEIEDQRYLRRIARETWRYFDDLVGPEHNWLPPDNSQEALRVEIADRTSPTNIGMWLMSAVSARDLGFLTPEQMIDRCTATIETLEKLERCEGHLLNWYNTRTLEPLAAQVRIHGRQRKSHRQPVGACAGRRGIGRRNRNWTTRALRGLADTLAVIMERFPPDHTTAVPLETLRGLFQEESSGIEIMERIRLAAEPARKLTESLRWSTSRHRGARLLVYAAGAADAELDPIFRSLFAMGGRSVGSSGRVSAAAGRQRDTGAPAAAARFAFLGRAGSRRSRPAAGHLCEHGR